MKEVGVMDTWEAVDSLRVVREFSKQPIPDEHLRRILNAGRRAGSSKNLQRWAFVVVQDRDHLRDLAGAGPFATHISGAAAAVALATPDPRDRGSPLSVTWDLGRAAQNMVLAAWELGIGSVPATVYDHDLVRKSLRLPPDQHCEFILSFGYPADRSALTGPKRKGGRLSLNEITHQEHWKGDKSEGEPPG
jgi:nitroreductase